MYILHIETSTKICSVALSRDQELLQSLDLSEGLNHTALLMPAIERLLKSGSLTPKDVSAVSVSSGPGSYTGLRVGSSTAKAMAYSLSIPILAVPTLLALATESFRLHPEADWAMPMLDARRNEVYTALFDRQLNLVLPVSSLLLDGMEVTEILSTQDKIIFSGDGAFKLDAYNLGYQGTIDDQILCKASYLVVPAYEMLKKGQFSDPMHFVPSYLKPPNITKQRKSL